MNWTILGPGFSIADLRIWFRVGFFASIPKLRSHFHDSTRPGGQNLRKATKNNYFQNCFSFFVVPPDRSKLFTGLAGDERCPTNLPETTGGVI